MKLKELQGTADRLKKIHPNLLASSQSWLINILLMIVDGDRQQMQEQLILHSLLLYDPCPSIDQRPGDFYWDGLKTSTGKVTSEKSSRRQHVCLKSKQPA